MIRNSEKTNTHYQKNYRAKNRLHNILGFFLPVQECVYQNGKNIPKILYNMIMGVCFFRIPYHAVLLGRPVEQSVFSRFSIAVLDSKGKAII